MGTICSANRCCEAGPASQSRPFEAKFDYAMGIPLTYIGHSDPVLPIYINAYLAPQPTMARYAFGEAIARVVTALGPT